MLSGACSSTADRLTSHTLLAIPPPWKVFLHVSSACNLHCAYCYFPDTQARYEELSAAELRCLWPHLVSLRPAKVVFTGGEPLLRPDILELLCDLKDADPSHSIIRCLNTNGHLVTRELARALVGLVDEVRVSVDALEGRNDTLRGSGSFSAAIGALDTLYAVGFEPKAGITVSSAALPDLEELVLLLAKHKITRISFNPLRLMGRAKGHMAWRVDPDEVRAAIHRAWPRCHLTFALPPEPRRQLHCGAGRLLNILPNGDAYPCTVLTGPEFRLGNVREQSLAHMYRPEGLLGSLAALDFRSLASEDPSLAPLAQQDTCLGDVYLRTQSCHAWSRYLPLGFQ